MIITNQKPGNRQQIGHNIFVPGGNAAMTFDLGLPSVSRLFGVRRTIYLYISCQQHRALYSYMFGPQAQLQIITPNSINSPMTYHNANSSKYIYATIGQLIDNPP
ncbi:hypothetical protein TWF569_009181 [Orbilia oligospora]|nr:hypothetical protein TWF706_001713 [Orbilia oligospora]KAF3127878.1 hypothetical protein TWF594_000541 [Orbilia oligospora]KAF3137480.1 hypothetical protein TWF569_009181 [Orbilia oligospora]